MSRFRGAIDRIVSGEEPASVVDDLLEVSPPGWSGTVKKMLSKHSDKFGTGPGQLNPYAIAWSKHGKGQHAHKKPVKYKEKEWSKRRKAHPDRKDWKSSYRPVRKKDA